MDASVDGGGIDAPGVDAPMDAGVDAPGVDAPMDAGVDAPFDAGHDAGSDAGVDAGGCHVQMLHVVATADDGQWEAAPSDLWSPDGTSGTLHCGSFSDTGPIFFYDWCYFRFAVQTTIPAAATSFSADLALLEAGFLNWDTLPDATRALVVFAEPVPATAISSMTEPMARTSALGTSVRWPTTGGLDWAASGTATSPELLPILGGAQTSGALVRDATIQVWVRGVDEGAEAYVQTPAFMAGTPSVTPTLTLRWCD
jgi:hypothetical protein